MKKLFGSIAIILTLATIFSCIPFYANINLVTFYIIDAKRIPHDNRARASQKTHTQTLSAFTLYFSKNAFKLPV